MQETFTADQFWSELDELGEEVVRKRVIAKVYGSGNNKLELAQEWLRRKEQSRDSAFKAEQTDIARSAKDAAWSAAEAAREAAKQAKAANTRATIALVIATISTIATIVTAFLRPS